MPSTKGMTGWAQGFSSRVTAEHGLLWKVGRKSLRGEYLICLGAFDLILCNLNLLIFPAGKFTMNIEL